MKKHIAGTAVAGHAGTNRSHPPAPRPSPPSAPLTTRKDIEQNTYTSERSERLRESRATTSE